MWVIFVPARFDSRPGGVFAGRPGGKVRGGRPASPARALPPGSGRTAVLPRPTRRASRPVRPARVAWRVRRGSLRTLAPRPLESYPKGNGRAASVGLRDRFASAPSPSLVPENRGIDASQSVAPSRTSASQSPRTADGYRIRVQHADARRSIADPPRASAQPPVASASQRYRAERGATSRGGRTDPRARLN